MEGLSTDIYKSVSDLRNLKNIWIYLKKIYLQVGQGVIYAIFKKLFNHLTINKQKGFEKSINTRMAELTTLVRRLRQAVTNNRDIWEDIQIVLFLEGLPADYNNIKTVITTAAKERTIYEIQNIIIIIKNRFKTDRETEVESNLIIII